MSVEQVDVVEDLSTAARANAAVRTLVTDPGSPAARSSDHLHASVNGLIDERVLSEARDDRPVVVKSAETVDLIGLAVGLAG
jgi:hypothetical protein